MELVFRNRRIVRDRALVMAIVNRTPDSFYDHGATFDEDAAKKAVDLAVADGADLIDLGGVPAGPGPEVTVAQERARIVEMVSWIRATYPDLLISVDTWRHQVADAACQAGAHVLNDAWGAFDPEMLDVAAAYGAGYVCCHAGRAPRTEPFRPDYGDVVATVRAEVTRLAELAESKGVPRPGIMIDATGFGKDTADHMLLLRHVSDFVRTGWPVLMALSNKDFVGETLGVELTDRLTGTLAATAVAAHAGAAVFRAHEVRPTRQTLEMVASIAGTRPPAMPETPTP
jgi:dihydropteroate synthase